ncbi:hypothetical protein [Sphingomonas turrisvirgatae]|uniref:Uncharacterized protein n=1 Tax=Sphingomonas turrisvirgatae TaxID=1888892 RepID=A0A1E3LQG2_9SPHN|nr:hypothetical protein [Sphingomonas turrisvirgatae]ODP35991.1 hypothetical protein BFL28_07850 [Sphingomonas turrisvirgatae]
MASQHDQDLEYFMRREQDERASAARTSDQSVRCIHLALADRYAERLRAMVPHASMQRRA